MSVALILRAAQPCWSQGAQDAAAPALVKPVQAGSGALVLIADDSPVRSRPDRGVPPFRIAAKGSTVRIIELANDWCHVEFDDPEFGPSTGFIRGRYTEAPRVDQTKAAFIIRPLAAPRGDRAWIALDAAASRYAQPGGVRYSYTPLVRDTLVAVADYPGLAGMGPSARVSVGMKVRGRFGAAGSYHHISAEQQPDVYVGVPSPFPPYPFATDRALGPIATWRQHALDISGAYTLPSTDIVRIRVLGGATYFRVIADTIVKFDYSQIVAAAPSVNVVRITSIDLQEISESAWGYHAGVDLAGFFSRHVGLGGTVRFSRGRAHATDPVSSELVEMRAGGLEAGGGIRLLF